MAVGFSCGSSPWGLDVTVDDQALREFPCGTEPATGTQPAESGTCPGYSLQCGGKHGLIVVIWDDLNTHISAAMRQMIDALDWLHVIRLPAYAPNLNPVEAVWSHRARTCTAEQSP